MAWFQNFWAVYSNLVLSLGTNALLALSIYLTLSGGMLAMANAGLRRNAITGRPEGTNGSQFFITTDPTPWLQGKHTIFGEVADDASRAVVDEIAAVRTGAGDRPVEPVVISSIDIAAV